MFNRRKFLSIFGGTAIATASSMFPFSKAFAEDTIKEFHDTLFEIYKKTPNDLFNISDREFLRLYDMAHFIRRIEDKKRTQVEKNLIMFYNNIKDRFLYKIFIRDVLDDLLEKGKFTIDINGFLDRVRNKEKSYDDETKSIKFREINAPLVAVLLRFSQELEVNKKLLFTIATLENNFGKNNTSNKDAKGVLQITDPTVNYLEEKYNITPKMANLKESDKNWRRIYLGVLNIKDIMNRLNVNLDENNIDLIDYIACLFAYNKGVSGLLEETAKTLKKNNGEVVEYVSLGITALKFRYEY